MSFGGSYNKLLLFLKTLGYSTIMEQYQKKSSDRPINLKLCLSALISIALKRGI